MRPKGGKDRSLTRRLAFIAAVLVVVTTVLLAIPAVIGVYSMARQQESARQRAYREVLVSQIENRLVVARRIVATLASSDVVVTGNSGAIRAALGRTVVGNAEYLDALYVTGGGSIGVFSAFPSGESLDRATIIEGQTLAVKVSDVRVMYGHGDVNSRSTVWIVQRIRDGSGDRYLWGRVAVDPVLSSLAQSVRSEPGVSLTLVNASGDAVWAAGDMGALKVEGLVFLETPADSGTGTVDLRSAAGEAYKGYWCALDEDLGLQWRAVVFEPADQAMLSTWRALRPAMFAWLFALVFALGLVLAVAAWVSRPLRELERQANALARGAHAQPLAIGRHDEFGRLAEAFNAVTSRLDQMHAASQVLSRSSEREEVFDGILTSVTSMLHPAGAGLLMREDSRHSFTVVRSNGLLEGERGIRLDADTSAMVATLTESDLPLQFAAGSAGDSFLERVMSPGGSGVAVSLVVGAEMLGMIVALTDSSAGFSDAELEMVRAFAAQAAVAAYNARLFASERSSRREAEMLRSVAESVAGPLPVQDKIDSVLTLTGHELDTPMTYMAVVDRARYGLDAAEDQWLETQLLSGWSEMRTVSAVAGAMAFDITTSSPAMQGCMRRMHVTYLVVAPVALDGVLVGLLAFGMVDSNSRHAVRRIRIADAVGTQLGLALQNASLFEEAKSRADDLETVFRISQAVSSSLDTKVVLNRVLDVVQKIFQADVVILMAFDPERKVLSVPMARGLIQPDVLEMHFQSGEDLPGRVFASKQPELHEALDDSENGFLASMRTSGMNSLLAVPLLARGRSIGVISLLAHQRGAFDRGDMELLRTFATQAALAIDTAGLFTREHYVATVLQESILPTNLPQIEGIDCASIYLPAGREAEIGGDYYDVFKAPDGRLALAIGDVCGKGVVAATKTSMVRYAIRGMIAAGLDPDRVLCEVNSMLVSFGEASDIVTVWLGLLDIKTGELTYADGGHPPALLLQPDGSMLRLSTTGALLGALDGAAYGQSVVTVQLGGTILLYTDGVTEARNKAKFFGEGRVRRALRAGGSAAAITQRLLAQVRRFGSGELRDDAAIVAIRRTSVGDGD